MKRRLLALSLVMASSMAFAAPETYNIDGNHSMARFSYSHFGYSTQLSKFDKTSGNIGITRSTK